MRYDLCILLYTLFTVVHGAQTFLNGTLVVVEKVGNKVHFVDLSDGSSRGVIEVGQTPHEIGAGAENLAVVPNYGARDPATMAILDLSTQELIKTIDLPFCVAPHHAEFIDGRRVAIVCDQSTNILIVDVIEERVVQLISTAPHMCHLLIVHPDSDLLFCSSRDDGYVPVVDLIQGRMITSILSGNYVEALAFNMDATIVWAANRFENTISIIDVATLQITNKFPISGVQPIRVKFTTDGFTVIVTNMETGTIQFFDAVSYQPLTELRIEGSATGLIGTLVIDDRYLAVADTVAKNGSFVGAVYIVDLTTLEVVQEIDLFDGPDGMVYLP